MNSTSNGNRKHSVNAGRPQPRGGGVRHRAQTQSRSGDGRTRRPIAKTLIPLAACALLAVLIGWRIWAVNQNQLSIPEEHYAMGEWVDLDGAFLYDNTEKTEGYSLRITSAELMTAPEYIDRYGKGSDDAEASSATTDSAATAAVGSGSTARDLSATGEYDDDESVLVLHYDVKNQGNDAGYIDMVTQWVMGDKKNRFYRCDYDLWQTAEPVMGETPVMILVKDSEHSTAVPFSNTQSRGLFANVNEEKRLQVTDENVHLVISNAPVRKVIDIELPSDDA